MLGYRLHCCERRDSLDLREAVLLMSNAVLDAKLLAAIGPPYAGQHGLADHLFESGITPFVIDERACLRPSTEVIEVSDETSILEEAGNLLFDRMLVNERTLLSVAFLSVEGLTHLLNLIARYRAEPVCLLSLDASLEVAIERHRGARRYNVDDDHLKHLYAAMKALDLSLLGIPVVGATALTYAVEGRDDGR